MDSNTFELVVPDMTCGHCVAAVTKAIKAQDADATVNISLADKRVTVETTEPREAIAATLSDAGYPPK